ncbi:MAG: U32 family peptidase [Desulfobacterium sp.]|jgi:putative protease|nr:U32 family peptidase [Desulfobacterium sp.]
MPSRDLKQKTRGGPVQISTMKKPELLAPAGDLEKLEIAVEFGADAVYLAGKEFSLRNFSGNFTDQDLTRGIELAHSAGVKVYLACNIYSRSPEQTAIARYLERLGHLNPDAVIIADPGIIDLAANIIPQIPIHLSTQANTTNYNAVNFWAKAGVRRVNLARELNLEEIAEIKRRTDLEIETFVHGAMCISYSGRCLLSNFLSGRDSNQGLCSHPCRWNYSVVEELRPGNFHSIMEDDRGSYLFNSKDLCMIDHIPELVEAGIDSLKIEGRMKGISYLASVVKAYRTAIDTYTADPDHFAPAPEWRQELAQLYHRGYCTGFYFNDPDQTLPNYENVKLGMIHGFIGRILDSPGEKQIRVEIKNKVSPGDTIEILTPRGKNPQTTVTQVLNKNMVAVDHAQPNTCSTLVLEMDVPCRGIVRKTIARSFSSAAARNK